MVSNETETLRAEVVRLKQDIDECWVPLYHATRAERDAAEAKAARVEALADDMDERGRPGANDSAHDIASRRQIREDVKRLRAALDAE